MVERKLLIPKIDSRYIWLLVVNIIFFPRNWNSSRNLYFFFLWHLPHFNLIFHLQVQEITWFTSDFKLCKHCTILRAIQTGGLSNSSWILAAFSSLFFWKSTDVESYLDKCPLSHSPTPCTYFVNYTCFGGKLFSNHWELTLGPFQKNNLLTFCGKFPFHHLPFKPMYHISASSFT